MTQQPATDQPERAAPHQPQRAAAPPHGQPSLRKRGGRRRPNLPYALVLSGFAAGLLWVWLSRAHVKGGTIMISAALLIAAAARFTLPDDRAGLLASRRRSVDVAAFAALGLALLALALVIPRPS